MSLLVVLATLMQPGPQEAAPTAAQEIEARPAPQQRGRGLHGYISYSASQPDDRAAYGMGMGFYSAAWTLIDEPLAQFQIGLASGWIVPDNSDNTDTPLAPEGTLARRWKERGPTWGSVFQTVEGGLGYWRGNRFRYGPPKFSMNATPQCYDYEVGSPGWSFFYDTEALPDHRLGIAQLSNRLLIPPDALPFDGAPEGKFLGYTYMALPFTAPVESVDGRAPTGDQAWTCFLSTANFKGPIAYYIPETWSKIADVFDYPFLHGRGLDTRAGRMGGGAMEINTVPQLVAEDAGGRTWSKIPALRFPVDEDGRAVLVQDVTYWSKAALYDAFLAWREGGPMPDGVFDPAGGYLATLRTRTPGFDQDGVSMRGVAETVDTAVFADNTWGLVWKEDGDAPAGRFPQYFRHDEDARVAVPADEVPAETGLHDAEFRLAERGAPFTSPGAGAWSAPGPAAGPFQIELGDGSRVTYCWYRFVDQPSFQQYAWSAEKKARLQEMVERIHREWPIDRDYMPPPTSGELVSLDPALFVTPPEGLEAGYVPIVIRQEDAAVERNLDPEAIDAIFDGMDGEDRPGCSLAVMHRGEVVYARGYGMADLERGIPNDADTVFRIASTSKQVTAACVQMLVLEGALSLDDPVGRWIPELPGYEQAPTVRHLLHHTSGIRDYLGILDEVGMAEEAVTEAKVLELMAREPALRFPPGTAFRYSNSNYFLLAVLVERVSGQRLRAFAAEHVFEPLGMEVTHFRDDHRAQVPARALGYTPTADGGWELSLTRMDIVGDGGVLTTVLEFARWMDNYRTGALGGNALLEAMLAPGWEHEDGGAYASGLDLSVHGGRPVLLHGGAWVGYRAEAMYFPEQELAILCFANAADARPTELCFAVADLLLAP